MQTLAPYEARFLEFAEGWLELGNLSEAERALGQISPMHRAHPKVLELRCRIHAAAAKWDQCMIVAEMLTDQTPNRPTGWLLLAAAEHGLGMTADAYETLVAVGEQFAELPEVTYELARYAAMLGDWSECEDWLARAVDMGGEELKRKAIADPLLKDFWARVAR